MAPLNYKEMSKQNINTKCIGQILLREITLLLIHSSREGEVDGEVWGEGEMDEERDWGISMRIRESRNGKENKAKEGEYIQYIRPQTVR